jgi:O-glycosyl hydrolase
MAHTRGRWGRWSRWKGLEMSYNNDQSKLPIARPLPGETIKVIMVPWACPCFMYVSYTDMERKTCNLWKQDIGEEPRLVQAIQIT